MPGLPAAQPTARMTIVAVCVWGDVAGSAIFQARRVGAGWSPGQLKFWQTAECGPSADPLSVCALPPIPPPHYVLFAGTVDTHRAALGRVRSPHSGLV